MQWRGWGGGEEQDASASLRNQVDRADQINQGDQINQVDKINQVDCSINQSFAFISVTRYATDSSGGKGGKTKHVLAYYQMRPYIRDNFFRRPS